MNKAERTQVAQLLQDWVARNHSRGGSRPRDDNWREYHVYLIESWRLYGFPGTGTLDRDAFYEFLEEALEDASD